MIGARMAARRRAALRTWYAENGRHDLPWRLTRDPYAVLISEVMLQQTQVERVRPYYERWMARWPTGSAFAEAALPDVIRAWSGLGYNRRAVQLHRAMAACGGVLPRSVKGLAGLPGIGPYTARAVASFALAQRVVVVDTNVGRVLARAFQGRAAVRDVQPAVLAATAAALLPRGGEEARSHSLALMDLGAMMCTARKPGCRACPWQRSCAWPAAGFPVASSSVAPAARFETTARFARGRIVELLRGVQSAALPELREALPDSHKGKVQAYLEALERDGLVARDTAGAWRLAGVQGSSSMASPKL